MWIICEEESDIYLWFSTLQDYSLILDVPVRVITYLLQSYHIANSYLLHIMVKGYGSRLVKFLLFKVNSQEYIKSIYRIHSKYDKVSKCDFRIDML